MCMGKFQVKQIMRSHRYCVADIVNNKIIQLGILADDWKLKYH